MPGGGSRGRTGRPPLTERRKAETRLEIARAAVRLFAARGVAATSAEDVAEAAGISVRTLWRYFPAKEDCVQPLFTAGIEAVARLLRGWRAGDEVTDLLDEAARDGGTGRADVPAMLALIRLVPTEPALRAVWLRAHDNAEPVFAAALAESTGDGLRARVRAAMLNAALRAAVEHHAWHTPPADRPEDDEDGLLDAVREAFRIAADGVSPHPG
ncbi:TetR/AcrR family transcriptional regulator [Actinosynnema sp. NPDC059797]